MRTAPVFLLTQALIFPLAELVATALAAQTDAPIAATATAPATVRPVVLRRRAAVPLITPNPQFPQYHMHFRHVLRVTASLNIRVVIE
jgi:hypothetical protein